MNYDVTAAPAIRALPVLDRERVQRPAPEQIEIGPRPRAEAPVVEIKPVPSHRLELSFHADLKALITRVVDDQTGDLVREYPARQVLDLVADVVARMRAREAAHS